MERVDLIIYHANCPDGLTSFWILKMRWPEADGHAAVYDSVPPDVNGKNVMIADFSYKRDVMVSLIKDAERVVILDHHDTSEKDLEGLSDEYGSCECVFDKTRAGAQITWDWVYGTDKKRPWIVEYVADRDLWLNKLPHTKSVSEAMWFYGYYRDHAQLSLLSKNDSPPSDLIMRGDILLHKKNKEIKAWALSSLECKFKMPSSERVYAVRASPCPRALRSDVGSKILSEFPCDFAVIYNYDLENDEWWLSLRSRGSDEHINVADIASLIDSTGGGHKSSAGCKLRGISSLREILQFL